MEKIVAVVVTYNRKELLQKCIQSLLVQSEVCDILIINNNSVDGTEHMLKNFSDYERVITYNMSENLGGAGGFNYGIKKALELQYDYMWLMDDDCIPYMDALESLLAADKIFNGDYGWLSSRVEWTDGSLCKMNIPKTVIINGPKIQRAVQATFVSLFIKSEVVREVGLPIADFYIWGDDVEYTRRITKRFHKTGYWVQTSTVSHEMAVNKGSNIAIDTVKRLPRYVYAFRNEYYLYKQEGVCGRFYYHLKVVYNLLKVLLLAKDHKRDRINMILQGYQEGRRFNPSVEQVI